MRRLILTFALGLTLAGCADGFLTDVGHVTITVIAVPDAPVAVAELLLDAIPARKGAATFARAHYAPPALQAVTRDFAFLVPTALPAGDLVRVVDSVEQKGTAAPVKQALSASK